MLKKRRKFTKGQAIVIKSKAIYGWRPWVTVEKDDPEHNQVWVKEISPAVKYEDIEEEEESNPGRNPMPRTETERLSFHERIFGKGSTPPLERLRRGQTTNDLLPMPPETGPPLPRILDIKWPWAK
ncbi:unnamed protein product [marine sediment metagenome]|uniref:Uncharacterized protein n=1 Tax=marine sediment metagenome TaxID=412755 RepID=X1RN59_9ZZZZ